MVKYNILLMLICIVSVPSFGLSWGIAQKKSSRKKIQIESTKHIMDADHENIVDEEYHPSDEDVLHILEELLEMPKDERVALMEVLKILDEEDITDSQSRSEPILTHGKIYQSLLLWHLWSCYSLCPGY